MSLLTAQRLLCRYWEFADEREPAVRECRALRYEVAVLEGAERAVSQELFLIRRRLALAECPLAELDLVEFFSGFRGWVFSIDWAREGYLVQVGRLDDDDEPIREESRVFLWGPSDLRGWRAVGRVPEAKALGAGWVDRSGW